MRDWSYRQFKGGHTKGAWFAITGSFLLYCIYENEEERLYSYRSHTSGGFAYLRRVQAC